MGEKVENDSINYTPEEKGVWFVFYHDMGAHPLFVSDDELVARRWADTNGYGDVKFWVFGTEWSNT